MMCCEPLLLQVSELLLDGNLLTELPSKVDIYKKVLKQGSHWLLQDP